MSGTESKIEMRLFKTYTENMRKISQFEQNKIIFV